MNNMTVESEAQNIYELATEERWLDMYPPTCTTQEQRANWVLQNIDPYPDMCAEAPGFALLVMQTVKKKFDAV